MSETVASPTTTTAVSSAATTAPVKDAVVPPKGQTITPLTLNHDEIAAYFNLPLYEACVHLKVDEASLKKRCRDLGILRFFTVTFFFEALGHFF